MGAPLLVSRRHRLSFFFLSLRPPPRSTLFPYTTLFRSCRAHPARPSPRAACRPTCPRSEEHTSELQSRVDLVCRLLLEKKKGAIKRQRADLASAYFRDNAPRWHRIRSLSVDEREVEAGL